MINTKGQNRTIGVTRAINRDLQKMNYFNDYFIYNSYILFSMLQVYSNWY